MGYTPRGLWYPDDDTPLKRLAGNFQKVQESVDHVLAETVGLERVVPAQISPSQGGTAYVDEDGYTRIKDCSYVLFDGLFDWETYSAYLIKLNFNQVTTNTGFSGKFRNQGQDYGGLGSYGWTRTLTDDTITVDKAVKDNGPGVPATVRTDRFPITGAPGADGDVSTAWADIEVRRAADLASASGWVQGGSNYHYNIIGNHTDYAYRATSRMFDGIRLYMTEPDGGTFGGFVAVYAYN